jgi:ferric-chelate reductase
MDSPTITHADGLLVARHIQDHDSAETLEPHWGYADRVLPCTNDPGSCTYLDVVYDAHDVGMFYTGILWLTIFGIVLVWAFVRHAGRPVSSGWLPLPSGPGSDPDSDLASESDPALSASAKPRTTAGGLARVRRSAAATVRHFLLPDSARFIFGRTTRLQVAVLAALCVYLTIWSFVGIVYNTWVTPVKNTPGVYNTRTSLGPWSDRVGVLAYALTPLSVMLSNRESLLSLLTGVPYQSFNFLHRWLGYIIFVQSALHTIGWCIVEIRLYQPQPLVAETWIRQTYMIWGVVAMILLTLLFVLSTPWGIRLTGYEFFRKAHYVLAMVYIGACWGHWEQLKCFLLPSLLFWFLDRGARLARTAFLHYHHLPSGHMGFRAAKATIKRFPDAEYGDVIRLDFENDQDIWAVGQHYYLCFTECSIWQSHPFTPLNAPIAKGGKVKHSYILRAKSGETKKVAELASRKAGSTAGEVTMPIIATGAYGERLLESLTPETNIVCVAGGTGITYVLPVLLELARQPLSPSREIELIWAMRHASNTEWIEQELDLLHKVGKAMNLTIRLFATRDVGSTPDRRSGGDAAAAEKDQVVNQTAGEVDSASSRDDQACDCGADVPVEKTGGHELDTQRHPELPRLLGDFVGSTVRGPTVVFASGPGGMVSDLRSIIAGLNSGSKVWRGDDKYNVSLVCDDRLEW